MNQTNFAGLTLKSPIIISSCGRTAKAENNKAFEEAGAGAVVLKSLFEENITREVEHLSNIDDHTEAADYMHAYIRSRVLADYLQLIRDSKRLCTIPIIASINCHSDGEWIQFANAIAGAGADAIELNIMSLPTATDYQDGSFERLHVSIVRDLSKTIHLPLIVKLGSNLSNPVSLIARLKANGAHAVVLFNRSYQPDINIDTMEYAAGHVLSNESDLSNSLRWTAIASAAIPNIDYAISGGVHTGAGIIKALLTGASAVEVSSAIYLHGNDWIKQATADVNAWETQHHYHGIHEYKGKMNAAQLGGNPDFWARTQFLRYFAGQE